MAASITPEDLRGLIRANRAPAVLDVRTTAEYMRGHVPGATNIPFHQVRRRIAEVPAGRNEPLVVYCAHGPRAWIAARVLRARGFRQVVYLRGHWAAWSATERSDTKSQRRT